MNRALGGRLCAILAVVMAIVAALAYVDRIHREHRPSLQFSRGGATTGFAVRAKALWFRVMTRENPFANLPRASVQLTDAFARAFPENSSLSGSTSISGAVQGALTGIQNLTVFRPPESERRPEKLG